MATRNPLTKGGIMAKKPRLTGAAREREMEAATDRITSDVYELLKQQREREKRRRSLWNRLQVFYLDNQYKFEVALFILVLCSPFLSLALWWFGFLGSPRTECGSGRGRWDC